MLVKRYPSLWRDLWGGAMESIPPLFKWKGRANKWLVDCIITEVLAVQDVATL